MTITLPRGGNARDRRRMRRAILHRSPILWHAVKMFARMAAQ
jgi:hypothetical protein